MSEKLWGGRFSEPTDRAVERFTASIRYDSRLFRHDIQGSIAHAAMLARVGIITEGDAARITDGLKRIETEIEAGELPFEDRLEDIHMHIESRLAELVGDAAKKLHTARSRNDQIALDIRLYLRAETRRVMDLMTRLRTALADMAENHLDMIMPGYTHLQRAQPVLLSHHLMAYYEMFTRDQERFAECLSRIDVMPLGAAALAGTPHPIDRRITAELLGFSRISANSLDTVADRDFMIEFAAAASIAMMHFSRLSEELILWASREFSFVEIADAFTTGSSIMPQKKNPDVCELTRGKTGRVYGALMTLLTLMKSLPLAYNRDMQEDKEPLFDTVDTLLSVLDVYVRMLPRIRFKQERMAAAAREGFLNATDMADYLVEKGVPFREAHHIVGQAVSHALSRNKELHDLSLADLAAFSSAFSEDVFQRLTPEDMIARRNVEGGTAKNNVLSQIKAARERLARDLSDASD